MLANSVQKNYKNGRAHLLLRSMLGLFLFLLIYDGALRKWILPEAQQILFIAKDALLLGLLLVMIRKRPSRTPAWMPRYAKMLLIFYVSWVFLEVININLPSVLVAIWGIKAHLLYMGILLLLPSVFASLDELIDWLERWYPWVVMPVCTLGFFHVAAAPDSFINQGLHGGMEGQSYFGETGLVRVFGPFSYITGMAAFLQATALLGIGLFFSGRRKRLFLIGLGMVLVALPITGSRGVVVVTAVSSILMLIGAIYGRLIGRRSALRVLVVGGGLLAASFIFQEDGWQALEERAEQAAHDEYRAVTVFTNAFAYFESAGLTGFGAGAANLGALALTDVPPLSWLPFGDHFEEESGRIVIELGIIGWFFSFAMRVAFLLWDIGLLVTGSRGVIGTAALIALPPMALGVYQGNGVFAPPVGAVYYWFCVALLAMAQYEHIRKQAHGMKSMRVRKLGTVRT